MKAEKFFSDQVTCRIWDQFFSRVRRVSKPLNGDQKRELILELQVHLLESFREEAGQNEAERLLNAIERMGAPEIFLNPILADRFIAKAERTLSPKTILQGLYYNAYRGLSMAVVSMLFGMAYLVTLSIAGMAILKPFFPKNIGLLFFDDGGIVCGFTLGDGQIVADPLGYWIIPIAGIIACLLYIGLTKFIRVLRKSKQE